MPRRVEDIVPNNHRSVKNIPKKTEAEKKSVGKVKDIRMRKISDVKDVDEEPVRIHKAPITPPASVSSYMPPRLPNKATRRGWKIFTVVFGVLVVVALAGYVASVYFSRAVFTITPRAIPVAVNTTLTADPQGQNGALAYAIIHATALASTSVPAKDGAPVVSKAQGNVTLYNIYSKSPWRLVAGTRLVNDSSKVYRLTSTINIPGYTVSSGGNIVPGTVVASVIADQAGSDYNITDANQTLKVSAYEGNIKFSSVYAKPNSNIAGGFIGSKKTIAPAVLASTTAALQARINSYIEEQLKGAVPQGYILYDSLILPTFSAPSISDNGPNSASVGIEGTVYGILLNAPDLIRKLAGNTAVDSFSGHSFDAQGLDAVSTTIANAKDFSPTKKNTLIIKMKGNVNLVGVIPLEELKKKFAGISLSETQNIMQSLSSIINLEKSSGQVVPPWSKIPSDTSRISIILGQ